MLAFDSNETYAICSKDSSLQVRTKLFDLPWEILFISCAGYRTLKYANSESSKIQKLSGPGKKM